MTLNYDTNEYYLIRIVIASIKYAVYTHLYCVQGSLYNSFGVRYYDICQKRLDRSTYEVPRIYYAL